MATDYPGALDGAPTTHDDVWDAVEAVETVLGVNPDGAYLSVAARLDEADTARTDMDEAINNKAASTHGHTTTQRVGYSSASPGGAVWTKVLTINVPTSPGDGFFVALTIASNDADSNGYAEIVLEGDPYYLTAYAQTRWWFYLSEIRTVQVSNGVLELWVIQYGTGHAYDYYLTATNNPALLTWANNGGWAGAPTGLVVQDAQPAVNVEDINAWGVPDSTTFLRGNGSWAVPPGTAAGHVHNYSQITAGVDETLQEHFSNYSLSDHLHDARYPVLSGGILQDASLPTRLRANCTDIGATDWNLATENGWYMSDTAANAPTSGWFFGQTISHNQTPGWHMQTLYPFTAGGFSTGADSGIWRRVRQSGTWGSWYRLRESQAELDARYANTNHFHDGSSIDSGLLDIPVRALSETVIHKGTTNGTVTMDLSTAVNFIINANGNVTIAFSNIPASLATTVTITIYGSGNGYTITKPTSTYGGWVGATPPTSTSGKHIVVTCYTPDGGATWLSSAAKEV